MIPLKLTIEGLYSYQKRQTVDFERLTRAHLFGIFGQVGSGKSSVLEAISFAIYGDTERLNTRDSRGYNMMNLKSENLLIEFTFESGINHRRYLATASARRNSRRFEDVGTIERKAFIDSGGTWLPVELSELEDAVGLSYANFKRTIIIPQGKFKDFLELGATDRTRMMKELFNLEKYDLAEKAARLSKANDLKRENIEGQLLQLGDISTEKVVEQKALLATKQTELSQNVATMDQIQREEVEMAKLQKLYVQLGEAEKALAGYMADGTGMQLLEQRLQKYELCMVHFKGDLEAEQRAVSNISSLSARLDADTKQKQKLAEELKRRQDEVLLLKSKNDRRDSLLKEAEDLEKMAQIALLEKELTNLTSRLERGEKMVGENSRKVEEYQLSIASILEKIGVLKEQMPERAALALAGAWHTKNVLLLEQMVALQNEVAAIEAEAARVNGLTLEICSDVLFDGYDGDNRIESIRKWLTTLAGMERMRKDEVKVRIKQLEIHARLKEYAVALRHGEACPLCGSVEHPSIATIATVDEELQQAVRDEDTAEANIVRIAGLELQLVALEQQQLAANRSLTEINVKIDELNRNLLEHQNTFVWKEFESVESVKMAQLQVLKIESEIEEQEKKRVELEKLLKKGLEDGINYRDLLESIRRECSEKESVRQLLKQQLTINPILSPDVEDVLSKAKMIREEVEVTSRLLDAALSIEVKVQQELGTIEGRIEVISATLNEERLSLDTIAAQLKSKLSRFGYSSAEEVKQVLAEGLDVEVERKRIETYKKELQALANRISQLKDEIGGRRYDSDSHSLIIQKLAEMNTVVTELNQEIGRIISNIEQLEHSLKMRRQLSVVLDALKVRGEELSVLKNLFYRSGFINYISTTFLQNLCAAANERFYKMTRQRLSLELTEDNNFQVRDYMNGGKTRNVKTLSGGQTFQASLALALALSDNIQKMQSADQNFFFLDEGFGTLDREALGVVFDTLKSLRRENRIVGVISHVEEMQQEIETYLKVVNHEDEGSTILASWE